MSDAGALSKHTGTAAHGGWVMQCYLVAPTLKSPFDVSHIKQSLQFLG